MQGMEIAPIVRTQDYSIIKQNEDMKAMLDQSHIGYNVEKKGQREAQEVVNANRTEFLNKSFDPREGGSNEYQGDGGQKRQKPPSKDKVIVKNQNPGFDFRV